MSSLRRWICIAALALRWTGTNAGEFIGSAGCGGQDEMDGLEFETGYQFKLGNICLNLIPLSGILYNKGGSRYAKETDFISSSYCRDSSSGQRTSYTYCTADLLAVSSIMIDFKLTPTRRVGGGVRFTDKSI